jgi:hypothetical protein
MKISLIGTDSKKRVTIDENTYTLSEPTVMHAPGTYSKSHQWVNPITGEHVYIIISSLIYFLHNYIFNFY